MGILNRLRQAAIELLRWSERFTRTDNVYLAKNGSFLILTQASNVLNGFVLFILISHFLPKEVYGQYKYFLSLFSLFALSTFTGVEVAVARAVANGHDGAVRAGFKRKLLGGFVGSLVAVACAGYYAWQGRNDLAFALVLLALFAPWIYAANVYGSAYSGKKRFDLYTKTNIITSLIAFSVMAGAFYVLRDPVQLFAAFLITSSCILIAYIWSLRVLSKGGVGGDTISFANHLTLLDFLGTFANNVDSVLVFHFLGAEALAIYSFAIVPVEQLKGFLKAAQTMAMPKFTESDLGMLKRTIGRKLAMFILVIAGLTGIYVLLVTPFFKIFFPAYQAAIPYSQVYALSLVFGVPGSLLATLFMAKGMRKETALYSIVNYVIQIVLLGLGAWLYGLWGVILARLTARTLMFFTTHAMLRRADPEAINEKV